MTVYIRTAAGTAAALNPLTKMPRHLRQLLVSIDGLTPTSTFAMRMAAENDIDVLLEALVRAGLIRRVDPAGRTQGTPAADALRAQAATGHPVREFTRPPSPSDDMPTYPAPLGTHATRASPQAFSLPGSAVPSTSTDAEARRGTAQLEPAVAVAAGASPDPGDDVFASFGSETAPAGLRPAAAGSYELGNLISLMSNFVTQHLPDRALEIVLTLESLTSISQLQSGLDDYRALIAPMGDAASRHLAELRHLLEPA